MVECGTIGRDVLSWTWTCYLITLVVVHVLYSMPPYASTICSSHIIGFQLLSNSWLWYLTKSHNLFVLVALLFKHVNPRVLSPTSWWLVSKDLVDMSLGPPLEGEGGTWGELHGCLLPPTTPSPPPLPKHLSVTLSPTCVAKMVCLLYHGSIASYTLF